MIGPSDVRPERARVGAMLPIAGTHIVRQAPRPCQGSCTFFPDRTKTRVSSAPYRAIIEE